jgi:hypothetical protein
LLFLQFSRSGAQAEQRIEALGSDASWPAITPILDRDRGQDAKQHATLIRPRGYGFIWRLSIRRFAGLTFLSSLCVAATTNDRDGNEDRQTKCYATAAAGPHQQSGRICQNHLQKVTGFGGTATDFMGTKCIRFGAMGPSSRASTVARFSAGAIA